MYFVIYPFVCYRFIITGIFFSFKPFFSITRSWTWLAVLRQCFSSGTAADGHTPAIPRTKHGQTKNWPKITTHEHINQIFVTFCLWFRCGVLCDRALRGLSVWDQWVTSLNPFWGAFNFRLIMFSGHALLNLVYPGICAEKKAYFISFHILTL